VPLRILHVSDLHTGSRDELRVEPALRTLVEQLRPELVIASGDLTHRGRTDQHVRASAFLAQLGPPVFAVPGNHDIPYTFPARFSRPWVAFERCWETTEPVFASDGLQVVGLNSVRPWRHQSGGLRRPALERAAARLAEARPGAFRVAVLHHQLIGAPWRTRKRPVARRNVVLASLVDAGAELIVSGHIHQATAAARHEFELWEGHEHGAAVAVAPGLGQPRPHRRGEARGLMVYDVSEHELRAQTYVWRRDEWGLAAERLFPRRPATRRPESPLAS
jgi:3',5'-cyclic AMP phosphodiesterase CpdA